MKRGKFIVIEGGSGCGKTTQINLLKKKLRNTEYYREPGGTPFGEKIRDAVQGLNHYHVDEYAALFAYSAARANLVRSVIRPKLKSGINIVLDRYWYSTYCYQGSNGVDKKTIITISEVAADKLIPDIIIYYDLNPKIGIRRKENKEDLDRYDIKKLAYHKKVRENYLDLSKLMGSRWVTVDADGPIEKINEQTLEILGRIGLAK